MSTIFCSYQTSVTEIFLVTALEGILETDKLDEIINDYLPTAVIEGISPDTVLITLTLKPTFLINFLQVTLTVDNVQ